MNRKQLREFFGELGDHIANEKRAMIEEGNEGPYELRAGRINALEWVRWRLQETLKVDGIIA